LTKLTLNQFIGNKQTAVIVILHKDSKDVSLGDFNGKGFYYDSAFPLYDQYANSNDPTRLMNDQFSKMKKEKPSPESTVSSIGWALTQQTSDVVAVYLSDASRTIKAFATYTNPRLAPELLPKCTSASYPSILGLDYIADTVPVAVSTAIHCLSDKAEYHSAVPARDPPTPTPRAISTRRARCRLRRGSRGPVRHA
jgi:hypothetical protein